jgi:hypothetical protein
MVARRWTQFSHFSLQQSHPWNQWGSWGSVWPSVLATASHTGRLQGGVRCRPGQVGCKAHFLADRRSLSRGRRPARLQQSCDAPSQVKNNEKCLLAILQWPMIRFQSRIISELKPMVKQDVADAFNKLGITHHYPTMLSSGEISGRCFKSSGLWPEVTWKTFWLEGFGEAVEYVTHTDCVKRVVRQREMKEMGLGSKK